MACSNPGEYVADDSDKTPYAGTPVKLTGSSYTPPGLPWTAVMCSSGTAQPDRAVTAICMPGDRDDDCGDYGVSGACAHLTGATETDVILSEAAPCAIGSGRTDGDGNFPVQCHGNSVLTGFGVSGSNADEFIDGTSYHNVGYCAAVQDGFVVDRSKPNFHTSTGWGDTVTCDTGTVATVFCNATGGNADCLSEDGTGGSNFGWIRCDTVKAAGGGPSCGPHGTLKAGTCVCNDGFTSSATSYCDTPKGTYCKNNGTWDAVNDRCSCGDYTGDQCQIAPSQSCGAHGTWNGTACSCKDGFANGDSGQCSVPSPTWCGKGEWKDGACACPSSSSGDRCEKSASHSSMLPIIVCVVVFCVAAGLIFAYKRKRR
jgi:hypothetical protein